MVRESGTLKPAGVERLTLIALLAGFSLTGATIRYVTLEKPAIEARLRAAAAANATREQTLQGLFKAAGCTGDHVAEQPVKHVKLPNVVCTLPAETGRTIIVGAHFDHVSTGLGVVDNWSGASLLPSLYQSLSTLPRRHTFLFIGFTEEEKGMIGSKAYAHEMSKDEVVQTSAMINLDSLGTSSTKLELNRGSKVLANALAAVAQTFKLPLAVVDVHQVGRSDSDSFQDRKIPSLNLHSLTQQTWPILHSNKDQMAAIQIDDYYDSYRLIAAYLAYLDEVLDPPGELQRVEKER
ncbi:MAG: M28 family metallopeptidase [Bryobacteraceae bacterium]